MPEEAINDPGGSVRYHGHFRRLRVEAHLVDADPGSRKPVILRVQGCQGGR